MIRIALLLALVVPSTAQADTSVAPEGAAAPPARCTYEDGPFWRARHAMTDDDARKLEPYDELRDASARYFLLSRWTTATGRDARVVDKRTHAVVRTFNVRALGLVEDRAGTLVGVLTLEGRQLALIAASSDQPRWRVPAPRGMQYDAFSALVDGDRLIVANYHRYATGATLFALDLGSGALRWTADVEQMNVAHSEYYNDVALERRGAAVVMRGFEAAGCYVQTFELAGGRRLSSVMQRRW